MLNIESMNRHRKYKMVEASGNAPLPSGSKPGELLSFAASIIKSFHPTNLQQIHPNANMPAPNKICSKACTNVFLNSVMLLVFFIKLACSQASTFSMLYALSIELAFSAILNLVTCHDVSSPFSKNIQSHAGSLHQDPSKTQDSPS